MRAGCEQGAGYRAARAGCRAARLMQTHCRADGGQRVLDAGPPRLMQGRSLEHLRGYMDASCAAITADIAGHSGTLAHGGTAAATADTEP